MLSSSCLFNFSIIKTGDNSFLFHLKLMISVIFFHRQALQSLAKYGVEPSPSNLLRVLELLGRRWDLTLDELVEMEFCRSRRRKEFLKIEFIFLVAGDKKGRLLVVLRSSSRYLNGHFLVPIFLLSRLLS